MDECEIKRCKRSSVLTYRDHKGDARGICQRHWNLHTDDEVKFSLKNPQVWKKGTRS